MRGEECGVGVRSVVWVRGVRCGCHECGVGVMSVVWV